MTIYSPLSLIGIISCGGWDCTTKDKLSICRYTWAFAGVGVCGSLAFKYNRLGQFGIFVLFFFRSIDVCISKYNNTNNKNRSRIIFETLSTPIMLVGEKVPAVSARCMFRINRQPSMGSGNNDTLAAANDLNTTFHPTLFFVYPNKWLFDSNIVSIPRQLPFNAIR